MLFSDVNGSEGRENTETTWDSVRCCEHCEFMWIHAKALVTKLDFAIPISSGFPSDSPQVSRNFPISMEFSAVADCEAFAEAARYVQTSEPWITVSDGENTWKHSGHGHSMGEIIIFMSQKP